MSLNERHPLNSQWFFQRYFCYTAYIFTVCSCFAITMRLFVNMSLLRDHYGIHTQISDSENKAHDMVRALGRARCNWGKIDRYFLELFPTVLRYRTINYIDYLREVSREIEKAELTSRWIKYRLSSVNYRSLIRFLSVCNSRIITIVKISEPTKELIGKRKSRRSWSVLRTKRPFVIGVLIISYRPIIKENELRVRVSRLTITSIPLRCTV